MSKPVPIDNPCMTCGACCGYFRVEFYWRESERDHPERVPPELTEELDEFKRAMKGTAGKRPIRCAALKGKIGAYAYCGIYLNRPSPCRAFQASYVDGSHQKRCDEARLAHGLKPLTPADWHAFDEGKRK